MSFVALRNICPLPTASIPCFAIHLHKNVLFVTCSFPLSLLVSIGYILLALFHRCVSQKCKLSFAECKYKNIRYISKFTVLKTKLSMLSRKSQHTRKNVKYEQSEKKDPSWIKQCFTWDMEVGFFPVRDKRHPCGRWFVLSFVRCSRMAVYVARIFIHIVDYFHLISQKLILMQKLFKYSQITFNIVTWF